MNKYKMPVNRRSAPRRRLVRRKLMARKYRPIRRGMWNPSKPNVYHFKRKYFVVDAFAVTTGSDFKLGVNFSLANLPNFTDFTNLYDMYRVNKIVYKIIPKFSETTMTTGINANLQQIHSVIDYDDTTAPVSISDLTQYQNHRMTRGNAIHTRVLVPKVKTTIDTLSDAPKARQWIDCDDSVLNHRGLKIYIPAPLAPATTISYDVEATFYVSFKSVV